MTKTPIERKARIESFLAKYESQPLGEKVVKMFYNTDSIMGFSRWDFLKDEVEKKELEIIFQELLLPIFKIRFESLKDIVDLNQQAFSMRIFRQICKARNIRIFRDNRKHKIKTLAGEFGFLPDKTKYIWIKPNLNAGQKLYVAAHEISHFLLHSENMLKESAASVAASLNRDIYQKPGIEKSGNLFAEIEADLLASMLLLDKVRHCSKTEKKDASSNNNKNM
jgi:hypothetical protein